MVRKRNQFRHRDDGITEIALSQGKIALIDTKDYPRVADYRWHYGSKGYARSSIRNGNQTTFLFMHHLILKPKPSCEVDHRNGNGCDNRRRNLRHLTHKKNLWNMRKQPGVSWHDWTKKWVARIRVDGKHIYLGVFLSLEDAIKARLSAERKFRPRFRKGVKISREISRRSNHVE